MISVSQLFPSNPVPEQSHVYISGGTLAVDDNKVVSGVGVATGFVGVIADEVNSDIVDGNSVVSPGVGPIECIGALDVLIVRVSMHLPPLMQGLLLHGANVLVDVMLLVVDVEVTVTVDISAVVVVDDTVPQITANKNISAKM